MLRFLANLAETLRAYTADEEPCYGSTPRSPEWSRERAAFIRDNPRCCITGDTKDVDVHHVKPFHLYPELELVRSNLRTIRRDLHLLIGHSGDWSAFNENFDEDVALMRRRRNERKYSR